MFYVVGVFDDVVIIGLMLEWVDKVLWVKVDGVWNLYEFIWYLDVLVFVLIDFNYRGLMWF